MKPKSEIKKKQPGARRRTRPLPDEYICIAPDESPKVFDWLNGAGKETDREVAEVHLRLCFHCQELVGNLMRLDEEFKNRAGRCLHHANLPHEQSLNVARGMYSFQAGQTESHQSTEDENPSKSMKVGGRS